MNMLKLTVFCALFATATAGGLCYEEVKVTEFSTGTGDKKVSHMAMVPAENKAFRNATIKTCPANEACYSYKVTATATVVETDSEGKPVMDGSNKKTTTGNMAFEAQSCLATAIATADASTVAICKEWDTTLNAEFAKDATLKDIVSNVKSTCGARTKCDGDKCVAEAYRNSAGGQCYEDAKVTEFSTGTGDKKESHMTMVPAKNKAFQKETVKTCAAKESCYSYKVTATATVVVTDKEGKPVMKDGKAETTTGNMAFEAQSCLPTATATADATSAPICKEWDTALKEEFAKDATLKDIISNVKATCGARTKCDGDKCVAKADRSSAATFGLSALLLTLLYLF